MSEEIMAAAGDLATVEALKGQVKALSLQVGILNTTIGYQDAMLARAQAVADADRAELDRARGVVAAMREIDHHRVGAYETDSGSVEPCDECGEMREIAAQALLTYDKSVTG